MSTKLVAAFLDRVQRSGLISESKLPQLRQELETQGVNLENPAAVAAALVDRGVLTQWQTEKLLQGKHKGFFLGSYRLLRPLGKGGMGAVFLAQHEMMRRQCAIKVLPQTQIDKHSSVLERFYVEAQAVASLDHQNIVRAYDVSKEVKDNKEIHYLVMEYVEGQDAQVMVQESGVLDYVKAAEIIRQTANGLAHAHENGLIHRDIKPANLLIDKKGVVKVLDLGLARFHDDSGAASLTAAHNETVLGTADYLSPEQALNSHNVDPRTDIYSLGCTAYFLLTGHPPFPEGSVAQRLVAHQVKQPKPIAEERRDAPPELTAIISKMMAKNQDDRYGTAAEIATALAAWLVQYGGEDWRRQHSEITGDSSVMNLLPQHREPTRSFSSAMSETELELAPLDEESAEPDASSVRAAEVQKPKGSGSIRPGKSGRRVKHKATDDVDLTLADDEQTPGTADADSSSSPLATPAPKETKSKAPSTLSEELPPLETAEPVATPDLLAELPVEDPLGSLDQVDLMGASESGSSLGALDSHVRLASVRGPSSSSRLTAARKESESRPKTLKENIQAIGLPILVGVAGGLLLVLIIVLLFVYSAGSPETTVRAPSGALPIAEPREPEQQPAADAATVSMPPVSPPPVSPDESTTPPAEPELAPGPPSLPATREPEAIDFQALAALNDSQAPATDQQGVPLAEPGEARKDRPGLEPEPDILPAKPAASPAAVKPAVEPERQPSPPAEPAKSPQELFAELTEFALDIKIGADPKSVPKDLARGLESLLQTVRNRLQASEKMISLRVVEQSDEAIMEVQVIPHLEPPYLVLNLTAELKCLTAGDAVVVWSADSRTQAKPEVFRFVPAQFDPRSTLRIWEQRVLDFFKPLGSDHREAKKAVGKQE